MSSIDKELDDLKNYIKLARESAYFGKYSEAINSFKKAIESTSRFKTQAKEIQAKQIWEKFHSEIQGEYDIVAELQSVNLGFKPQSNAVNKNNVSEQQQPNIQHQQFNNNERKLKNNLFRQNENDNFLQKQYDLQQNIINNGNIFQNQPQNNKQNQVGRQGHIGQNNNNYQQVNQNNYEYNDYKDNFQENPSTNFKSPNMEFNQKLPNQPPNDSDLWFDQLRKPNNKPQPQQQQQQKRVPYQNIKDKGRKDNQKIVQKSGPEQVVPGKKKGQEEQKKSFLNFVYPNGVGPDSDLISMLERDVVDQNPNISFDNIAELDKAKDMLQEAVLLPIRIPQFFRGIRRPLKGVLMFGPPGTGKTMLAKAVATTGQTTFFNVSASSLASKWRGDAEKLVRILFEMARYYSPSTIFFDEIDAIGSKRGDGENEASRKMKAEMLIQIDGVSSSSTDEKDRKYVMVLAATNRPWDLDEALRRRLEKRILIPLPSTLGRKQLFELNMKGIKCSDDINWNELVSKTDGYSGADIASLCREAAFMPMRRKLIKEGGFKNIDNIENLAQESDIPLTQKDFEESLRNVNKSVSNDDLGNFEKWMAEFGSV